jgi:superfamily I DNA/RNA helicase
MSWVNKILRSLQLTKRKDFYSSVVQLRNKHKNFLFLAYNLGCILGYNKAKTDLTSTIVHTHQALPELELINKNIVDSSKLNFNIKDINTFDEEFLNSLNYPPDEEQRKLIFSGSRNTLAIAGAGSGKSTSLIYRLLFLHTQCFVSLDDITVFSFTKASVNDFRDKLIEVFAKYGIEVTKKKSEKIIRTFHSKVLEMAKTSFLNGNEKIFEFIKEEDLDQTSIDQALVSANEQFVSISKLSDGQNKLLLEALDICYSQSKKFKKIIDLLFIEKLKGAMDDDSVPNTTKGIISKTEDFDKVLSPMMQNYFSLDDYIGQEITFENTDFPTLRLKSDAYIPELDTHIVFYPHYNDLIKSELPTEVTLNYNSKKFSQYTYTLIKRKTYLLRHKSNKKVFAIRNETDLLILKNLIKNKTEDNETPKNCPRFEVKLSGDLGFSELQDAFYNLGSFSESLGVPVKDISKQLGKTYIKGCDKLFAEALSMFWPFFTEKLLPHYNVVRFHDMFINFSNPNNTCFDKLSNQTKSSLSNIFIDEFQDISPEVSNWIKATLRRLKGEQRNTSLMCVGDDYQSIYGWRGSSPEFINNYQKYFPSENINPIEMSSNYRSYQLIVSAAESALAYNRSSVKTGICKSDDNKERLILNDFQEKELINKVKEELTPLISRLSQQEWSKTEKGLLILTKTNDMLSKIKQSLNLKTVPDWIQFETFHRSKGLEADYCFLVEDCSYDSNNILRNYLYKLAGFSLSYDDAQKEEAMRLAYVGLTRAKLKLWWFVKENPTGSFVNVDNYIKQRPTTKVQHQIEYGEII